MQAVVAVAAGDEEYRKALKGPTYARIREFHYSSSKPKSVTENFRDENSSVQEQVTEEILHDFLPVNKVGDASTVEIEEAAPKDLDAKLNKIKGMKMVRILPKLTEGEEMF